MLQILQAVRAFCKTRSHLAGKEAIKAMIADQKQRVKDASDVVKDQENLLRDVRAMRDPINTLTTRGFLNLPQQIVQHFQTGSFTWGGEWSGAAKDYIHFERGTLAP